MRIKLIVLSLIMIIISLQNCATRPIQEEALVPITLDNFEEPPSPERGEVVMRAMAEAYPNHIHSVERRNGDWAFILRDTWFYYADGKLLSEDQREEAENYRSLQFYRYPAELPEWIPLSQEQDERIRTRRRENAQNPTMRSSFLDVLWQSTNFADTEPQMVRIEFLGKNFQVHKFIHDITMVVEAQIRAAARADPVIQAWIDDLGTVASWGWRNIAASQSRSYHSYGIALDFLPKVIGTRQTYWLWTIQHREDFWNVSYNERYHPPAAVIRAFEANGFIWGGKWFNYDTMHFEYRPEILILNGMPPAGRITEN